MRGPGGIAGWPRARGPRRPAPRPTGYALPAPWAECAPPLAPREPLLERESEPASARPRPYAPDNRRGTFPKRVWTALRPAPADDRPRRAAAPAAIGDPFHRW